jgi:hypothetical protein
MGFDLGNALGGAAGGFLTGGGPGALVGGVLGGFGGDGNVGPTQIDTTQQLNKDLTQTGSQATTGSSTTNNTGFQNLNTTGTSAGTTSGTSQGTSAGTSALDTAGTSLGTTSGTNTQSGAGTSQVAQFQLPFIMEMLNQAQNQLLGGAPLVAGFTPAQIQGQQQLLGQAAPAVQQLAGNTASSLGFLQNPNLLSPDTNPYLAASAQASLNPLINSLQRQILPGIDSAAVAADGVGGSRHGIAQGNAINQFQQTAGDMLANQFNAAYQNGLGTMLAANNQAPQLASLFQQPGNIFNQVGGQQQALNQALLGEPFQRLAQFQQFVGTPFGTDTTTTGTGTTAGTTTGETTGTQRGTTTGTTTGATTGTTAGTTTGTQAGTSGSTSQTINEQLVNSLLNQLVNQQVNTTKLVQLPDQDNPFAQLGAGLTLGQFANQSPFFNPPTNQLSTQAQNEATLIDAPAGTN